MSTSRYELKFILDLAGMSRAQSWLMMHTSAKKTHPSRYVNSVYFDDPGYSSVRDNLAGVSDRRKLRLRWYHDHEGEVLSPTFEAKFRHGRLGSKDRFFLEGMGSEIMSLPFARLFSKVHDGIGGDEKFLVDSYLSPTLHVCYKRDYYEGLRGIRVTFDHQIRFYNPLFQHKPFQGSAISYPHLIMEIKFAQSEKDMLGASLRKFNLTPKRHSKYLTGLAALGLATYI